MGPLHLLVFAGNGQIGPSCGRIDWVWSWANQAFAIWRVGQRCRPSVGRASNEGIEQANLGKASSERPAKAVDERRTKASA
ncbi:hypothetical protein NL676_031099 [Syzygium grande]|nr:hypothetical protein NL676_031099 [Syzygium grande]